ncbi:hypothetical protein EZV62_018434 [Acer yangbiense]|uniref:SWIM-type domain-containing protein n=1 Tax=Acer yangbiense TaxID=1000413 RepID=A0A5C7HJD8_9ROSI|nr:hypothetical protein EZV62_018434 [Acer yangbiense]
MEVLEVVVHYGTTVHDVGTWDVEHISIITLLHAMNEKNTGVDQVPSGDYFVFVLLPWCSEKVEVKTDNDLVELFRMFSENGCTRIVFEVEDKPYIPLPPEGPSAIPNVNHELLVDNYQNLEWSDFEENELNYLGDNEGGGFEGDDIQEVGSEAVEQEHDNIVNLELFEGYQSHEDDEFFSDSDEENNKAKLAKLIDGNPFKKITGGEIEFKVGETHDSVYTLRALLIDYAIQEGINFDKVKNDNDRLTYRCKWKGCPWRIHASRLIDGVTMMVKTYNPNHECHRVYKNAEAKVTWIASKFELLVKCNPDIKIGVIADLLRDKFKVNVDAQRLYKAKRKALDGLGRQHAECFGLLRRYACIVNVCNPGSAVHIRLQQPEPTFQRFFISFEAQRAGFLGGCRPFIGLDGCHLKGPYGGVLLSAIALDANNGLYPLAFCICEGETLLSWCWFLKNLKLFLKYPTNNSICFMSDRQKGVLGALKIHWPNATTRYCARHIYANFRVKHSGQELKKLFWKASKAYDVNEFNSIMANIRDVSMDARLWLNEIEAKHWSRHAFDPSIKCDHVTNNMTESFNSMLGDHRARTYLNLIEFIRRMVMKRFQERKEECSRWKTEIPPNVSSKVLKASKESRILRMINAGDGEYELIEYSTTYVVKLGSFTCDCGAWQISGVPCSHAMAGISHFFGMVGVSDQISDYIHPSLTKTAFLNTYINMIHPIPDQSRWPQVASASIIPPPIKRQPGRPKLQRKKEPSEKPRETRSGSVVCQACKQVGHNKRTCSKANQSNKKVLLNSNVVLRDVHNFKGRPNHKAVLPLPNLKVRPIIQVKPNPNHKSQPI